MSVELDQRFRDTVLQELSDLSKESRNMTLAVASIKSEVTTSKNEVTRLLDILERGDSPLIYQVQSMDRDLKRDGEDTRRELKNLVTKIDSNTKEIEEIKRNQQNQAVKDAGQGTKNDLMWRLTIGIVSLILGAVGAAIVALILI